MELPSISDSNAKRLRMILMGILLLACLWAGRFGGGGDFEVLRSSVINAWQGNYTQVYLKEASGPFFYPPSALVMFGFFALFSDWQFAILGNLLFHTVSFIFFWFGLGSLFPDLFKGEKFYRWLLTFLLAVAPLHLDFMGQNINLPVAAFLIGNEIFRKSDSGRKQFGVGFLAGVISLIKIFPLFILGTYWLLGKSSLRKGMLAGIVFSLISPIVFFGKGGVQLYGHFFDTILIYHDKNDLLSNGTLNLPGLLAVWGQSFLSKRALYVAVAVVPVACATGFFLWIFGQKKYFKENRTAIWALSVGVMVFLNSSSRPDYFMFYVPIFAFLMEQWKKLRTIEKICTLGSFALIALTQQAMVGRDWNIQLQCARIPVVGMALLNLAGLLVFRRQQKSIS